MPKSEARKLETCDERRRRLIEALDSRDRRVLDASDLILDSSLRRIADENGGCLADWARAELGRRKADYEPR